MAVIEMLLGLRSPQGLKGEIVCYMDSGVVQGLVNGSTDTECIGELRERFAKLKARDNLLGAVLARLGADPGARETEAHNAVGRLLEDRNKASQESDRRGALLNRIAQGLGLDHVGSYENLEAAIFAQHADLTSALAKAQDEVKRLKEQLGGMTDLMERERASHALAREEASCEFVGRMNSAEAEVKALTERLNAANAALSAETEARMQAEVELHDERVSAKAEIAKLKAELEASATREKRTDAALRSQMDDTRAAEAYIASLKAKLAETDLERVLAEARVSGLGAELQALEHALRSRLPLP